MHVLHVGDDPTGGGGIASVVLRHLSRSLDGEDQNALETALANLISVDGERERQAVANRKRAEVLFSPPAIARAWMTVYANLPGSGKAFQSKYGESDRLRSPNHKKENWAVGV